MLLGVNGQQKKIAIWGFSIRESPRAYIERLTVDRMLTGFVAFETLKFKLLCRFVNKSTAFI